MILVIDAFKLVKGAGKSIGIYNLTRSLVEYLSAENVRRGCPETIIARSSFSSTAIRSTGKHSPGGSLSASRGFFAGIMRILRCFRGGTGLWCTVGRMR